MTVALQYNLKSGRLISPASFFFLKTALAIWGLLCFHMNCEIFHSSSVKNAIGDLIGITLTVDCKLLDGRDWLWEKPWSCSGVQGLAQ